jgi:hypothetical protein
METCKGCAACDAAKVVRDAVADATFWQVGKASLSAFEMTTSDGRQFEVVVTEVPRWSR